MTRSERLLASRFAPAFREEVAWQGLRPRVGDSSVGIVFGEASYEPLVLRLFRVNFGRAKEDSSGGSRRGSASGGGVDDAGRAARATPVAAFEGGVTAEALLAFLRLWAVQP